ncbi:MAG: hypothetical protein AB2L14_08980 [Candidatus Xenobiia bacterium LiM19]
MEGPSGGVSGGGVPGGSEPKKGMPTWLKVVLIVLGVMILLCGGGIFAIYQFGKSFVKNATDPEAKKRITSEICPIDVPSDYTIDAALDLAGIKLSMIKYPRNGQQIMFMKLPKSAGSDQDIMKSFGNENFSNELLKQQGDKSIRIDKVKENAKVKINGHDFSYVYCDFDQRGKKQEGIMGFYYCPERKSGFIVYALNDPGNYDNKVTLDLLGDVKCCESGKANQEKASEEEEPETEEK